MSQCALAFLIPMWIGIAFNVAFTCFNLISMSAGFNGRFIDWYLEQHGGFKIMGSVWAALIAWTIYNAAKTCS